MKKKNPEFMMKYFPKLFLAIGALMLVIGVYNSFSVWQLSSKGILIDGTVVDVSAHQGNKGGRTYTPTFSFTTVDKKNLTIRSKYSSSSFRKYTKGGPIPVIYQKDSPESARVNEELWLLPLILTGQGVFFIVISTFFQKKVRIFMQDESLKQTGMVVTARYINIETVFKSGNKNGFSLICEGADPIRGTVRRFKGGILWEGLPKGIIPGCTINVYIDKKNPEKYYVDYKSLTQLAA